MNKVDPIYKDTYQEPGRYTVQLPITPPDSGLLVISMTTEHGLYFEDTVWVRLILYIYMYIIIVLINLVFVL